MLGQLAAWLQLVDESEKVLQLCGCAVCLHVDEASASVAMHARAGVGVIAGVEREHIMREAYRARRGARVGMGGSKSQANPAEGQDAEENTDVDLLSVQHSEVYE